jgi:signal transduction histidine kinase
MAPDRGNDRTEPRGHQVYTLVQAAEGQASGWESARLEPDDTVWEAPRHRRPSRLSLAAKLTLGVLVAALPPSAIVVWLAWDTPHLWLVCAGCLVALVLGMATVTRAQLPLSRLADRARRLAGMPMKSRQLLGLVRRDLAQDKVFAVALDQIEQSLQEIRALNRIGQLVTSNEDLERILSAIVEEAVALLRADAGIIGYWDPEQEVFHDVAACNMPIMFPGREFRTRESFSSQVAKTGQVLFLEDYSTYTYRVPELERFRLRATLGAPLMVDGQSRGAVAVQTVDPTRRFTPREGELLATFASQAGAAFEKARLYQLALDQLEELRKARTDLAKESKELEQALAAMVRVQEEERARIAADVHDGVVQMMVGSLCELQAAMAHFPHELDMVEAKQQKSRALIRDSITELRRVIFDLRPITLDTAGLVPAVENLVEDMSSIFDAHLELRTSGRPCRFLSEVEIGAYRIIQEAVNNALTHANANSVTISTRFANGTLEITVSDDGQGFSVEEAISIHGQHAGLIGMRERARSLGGELSVASAVARGTTVSAQIPCRPRTRGSRPSGVPQEPVSDWPNGTIADGEGTAGMF